MLHVISTRCVARDLHTIAPWPLERTCWRQFAAAGPLPPGWPLTTRLATYHQADPLPPVRPLTTRLAPYHQAGHLPPRLAPYHQADPLPPGWPLTTRLAPYHQAGHLPPGWPLTTRPATYHSAMETAFCRRDTRHTDTLGGRQTFISV